MGRTREGERRESFGKELFPAAPRVLKPVFVTMASKINLSRHWEHISSDTYDIPKPSLAPGHMAAAAAEKRDLFRDTDSAKDRRNYARKYMQGKGLAFLGMGLGTDEVTSLRTITPGHIRTEHSRARAHTPSQIIPGLRKVSCCPKWVHDARETDNNESQRAHPPPPGTRSTTKRWRVNWQ